MKLSWGYKIAIAYLVFVAGILYLVYRANNEHYDLVTEQYYDQELKYQEVLDQKNRVTQLSSAALISREGNSLQLQFPKECTGKEVKGEVYLYKASDASQDIRKPFVSAALQYSVPLDKAGSGMYTVKLSWSFDGRNYYQEQTLFL